MDECNHKIDMNIKDVLLMRKKHCNKCGAKLSLCERDCILGWIVNALLGKTIQVILVIYQDAFLPKMSFKLYYIITEILFISLFYIGLWLTYKHGKWTDEWDK